MIKKLEALQKFLQSLNSLRQQGLIKTVDQAVAFAKQEFGEVNDLFRRQIEQIFKGPIKKAPPPGGGGITSIKNAPKKETPDQASGVPVNPYKPKKGLDPVEGMTRTAARVVLDRYGIKVPERVDPIEAFEENFGGDALMDLKDVGEELLEKETRGKITESMGEFLESRGMFDLKVDKTLPKGMSNKELLEKMEEVEQEDILKKFDPEDREPNSEGGINRTSFALGGMKALMAIINQIKKLDPMDAMKEVNKVIAKEGKYKNLSDAETKKIFDDTQDHIFERDVKPKETDVNFDDEVDLPEGVDPRDTILPTKKILDDVDEAYGMAPKMVERFELKQKYPGIDDNLLTQIIDDPDPQRKAEALATIDQAFELMRQGKSPDEILDIMKKMTDRTKQAKGGLSYLMGM